MDSAKMNQNTFSFDNDFFNLTKLISDALN